MKTEPISVVQAFYAALNASDVDQALTFLAEEVVFATLHGKFSGKPAVAQLLSTLVTGGFTFTLTNLHHDAGRVRYAYRIFAHGTQIDAGDDGLALVCNGLITFDGTQGS